MAQTTGAEALYPSGFTAHGSTAGIKVIKDAEVAYLYIRLKQDRGLAENWEFKDAVLAATARLLFPLTNWGVAQRANTLLCKYQLAFVNDTLLVALGQHRPVSLQTRVRMFLDLTPENRVKYNDLDRVEIYFPRTTLSKLGECAQGQLLANLSNTPAKIIDLIETLYVMFGAGE